MHFSQFTCFTDRKKLNKQDINLIIDKIMYCICCFNIKGKLLTLLPENVGSLLKPEEPPGFHAKTTNDTAVIFMTISVQ